jgi:NAD(P)-dependent dehydrogenase (short-subunit alcohol dehydrogenase family)
MEPIGCDLKGKVAIITGGTSGIGYGIAVGFAELGCHVVPTSEPATESRIRKTVDELQTLGVQSLETVTDVTDIDQVERLVRKVIEKFGRIDVLVNCAGITIRKPSVDMTEKEWDAVIDVNLKGTFLACQRVGRVMLKQRSGSIINIASLASFVAYPEVVAYCASKGGVVTLTKALAIEWAERGVRVNGIAPGDIMTPLTRSVIEKDPKRRMSMEARIPMGRLGEVDEVVGAAIYLASDASRYVTGHTIVVDGGHLAEGI